MGGSASVINPTSNNFLGGGTLGSIGRKASVLNPQFLGGGMTGRVGRDVATMGLGEFTQENPFGIPGNPIAGVFGNGKTMAGSGTNNDPFYIDPSQIAADQASINNLGTTQKGELDQFNSNDQAARAKARQSLSDALTTQSQDYFKQGLPATEETLNAQHLLNGSGLGQELARQQGNLATNIANQVGVQGMNDINRSSDLGLAALQGQQGMQNQALSRGFSLNDFVNQANVAKSIGATMAPQVGNGKGQTGTLLGGIGSVAGPAVSLAKTAGKAAAV